MEGMVGVVQGLIEVLTEDGCGVDLKKVCCVCRAWEGERTLERAHHERMQEGGLCWRAVEVQDSVLDWSVRDSGTGYGDGF